MSAILIIALYAAHATQTDFTGTNNIDDIIESDPSADSQPLPAVEERPSGPRTPEFQEEPQTKTKSVGRPRLTPEQRAAAEQKRKDKRKASREQNNRMMLTI